MSKVHDPYRVQTRPFGLPLRHCGYALYVPSNPSPKCPRRLMLGSLQLLSPHAQQHAAAEFDLPSIKTSLDGALCVSTRVLLFYKRVNQITR